ncbi:MAG: DUF1294 domain-containing protein [Gammaproteobacteria bacterium]|nr:DUF1294 domain-containing protein [Gammaproteobacteria bacterium]
MRTKGKITSWNDEKGYGFIAPVLGGERIFIHINAFKDRSRRPDIGQIVSYDISSDKQGRSCASKATRVGDKVKKHKKNGNLLVAASTVFISVVAIAVLAGKLPPIILAYYIVISLITYALYASDKAAAKKGNWRTSENTLHTFSFAGGWPGALIAQEKLRHKSRKESFRFVFWVTVLCNIAAFIWLFTSTGVSVLNAML